MDKESGSTTVDSKAGPVKFELPDDYEVINVVGEVRTVLWHKERVADLVSTLRSESITCILQGHIMTKRILREIKMLRHLNHRNI